ncbi:MAG: tetratricopeptide repeat protein [Phycisphaeraceae bacterium]
MMMLSRLPHEVRSGMCLLFLAGVLGGCSGVPGIAEHREGAESRWWTLRGSMVLEQAEQHFDNGDLGQAEAALNEAARIDPDNAEVLTLAGRIAIERGELERAALTLRTAIEAVPEAAAPRYYLGIIEQRWQRPQAARERYSEAVERAPDNPEYVLALAESEVALGRDDKAAEILTERLDYFAQPAELHHALAQVLLLKDRKREAIDHLRQAVTLDPDRVEFRAELGIQLVAAGRSVEAIDLLTPLLSDPIQQTRRDLRRALARANRDAGRWSEARRLYRELVRESEPSADDLMHLAAVSWELGDFGGAETAAGRAHDLSPRDPEAMIWLGLAARQRNDHQRALGWFRSATEVSPNHAKAWALYGVGLEQVGRRDEAIGAYRRASQLDPTNARFRALQTLRPEGRRSRPS